MQENIYHIVDILKHIFSRLISHNCFMKKLNKHTYIILFHTPFSNVWCFFFCNLMIDIVCDNVIWAEKNISNDFKCGLDVQFWSRREKSIYLSNYHHSVTFQWNYWCLIMIDFKASRIEICYIALSIIRKGD